ncbi:MAG: acetyl-CoA carboxylase carboxyl transferase subunit alpha, partial [Pseudomonadota bacterium]
MQTVLEFEKPIVELEDKIEEIRRLHADGALDVDLDDEVGKLNAKAEKLLIATYAKLTPWQK